MSAVYENIRLNGSQVDDQSDSYYSEETDFEFAGGVFTNQSLSDDEQMQQLQNALDNLG